MSEGVMLYVMLSIVAVCFTIVELWSSWLNYKENMNDKSTRRSD